MAGIEDVSLLQAYRHFLKEEPPLITIPTSLAALLFLGMQFDIAVNGENSFLVKHKIISAEYTAPQKLTNLDCIIK